MKSIEIGCTIIISLLSPACFANSQGTSGLIAVSFMQTNTAAKQAVKKNAAKNHNGFGLYQFTIQLSISIMG